MRRVLLAGIVFACISTSVMAGGFIRAGRDIEERTFSIGPLVGQVTDMQAMVQETTRQYYDATDQSFKQDLAENYDLNDFGMEGPYPSVGVTMEGLGQFFSYQIDIYGMHPSVDTVAKRNYYIGVGDPVEYGGGSYENMKIPEGAPFEMDILAAVAEGRVIWSPFTIAPSDSFKITPSLNAGLYSFWGSYDIDAGEASGVTQYLEPPEDFVVGGKSSGLVGIGLPEFGFGAELRIGSSDAVNFSFKGHYAMLQYEGPTTFFTSSQHREKDLDLDHKNMKAQCKLSFPRENGNEFFLGAMYQSVESDASITSNAETTEEIIASRERFDKDVVFEVTSLQGMAGFTF